MITASMRNGLRLFSFEMTESAEMASNLESQFENKFNSLDKYDQMLIAASIEIDGWKSAFEKVDIPVG